MVAVVYNATGCDGKCTQCFVTSIIFNLAWPCVKDMAIVHIFRVRYSFFPHYLKILDWVSFQF